MTLFTTGLRRVLPAAGALALACGPQAAAAHEFWIQPERFWLSVDAATPMVLQVGTGAERQRSQLPIRRVLRFDAAAPGGEALDLRPALTLGAETADGALGFSRPGAYVVTLRSDAAAQSHLSAARFNAYAEEEGLTPALEARAARGLRAIDASERYSRQTKALIQVGEGGDQGAVVKPVGLTLEIVPEASPYALPRPATLPVRVLYEGRPLAGALVKITDLAHDAAPHEQHRTDGEGRAGFAMPADGAWMMDVVWTRPLTDEGVDFETVFSSLSFGFPAGAR
ncbi:hypothetical protein ASD21_00935 [Caulobacter sp. Root1455]|uniref:DUF4198 domain-containing protein n=1 Tax=Caulobacter sp. Root1455 TaxID=1736465 RepID=UPI0006FC8EF5|nr:DUF4198 domain-containing protein [Caulobacter sp. Root1455]KQZ06234.1 hypothetical protein ASD21_00935 [Caulobacter sp. Root1455]